MKFFCKYLTKNFFSKLLTFIMTYIGYYDLILSLKKLMIFKVT